MSNTASSPPNALILTTTEVISPSGSGASASQQVRLTLSDGVTTALLRDLGTFGLTAKLPQVREVVSLPQDGSLLFVLEQVASGGTGGGIAQPWDFLSRTPPDPSGRALVMQIAKQFEG